MHAITGPAPEECPQCGACKSLQKLVTAARGIFFKGSGFYETDYKRAGTKPAEEASQAATTSTEQSSKKKCNPGCGCHS